ncbi:hypothetical protein FGO68_gene8610 [Halteria grandinella]|uniref:Uncharacterized protein n=1 Tax=Halteria grandinella TaxID=5974 RepID=A0A8J8NIP2_HALGN|nr:hypothetical protein FGO68_gene8610 [Halteria grandinella]
MHRIPSELRSQADQGEVSTEVGDRSGNPRADSLLPFAPEAIDLVRRSRFARMPVRRDGGPLFVDIQMNMREGSQDLKRRAIVCEMRAEDLIILQLKLIQCLVVYILYQLGGVLLISLFF